MADAGEMWDTPLFHSLPRFDLTLNPINSTFNPLDFKYVQSILIWAVVPILCLLLILLIYVIYYYIKTCRAQTKPKRTVCATVSVCVIVLLACGSIGIGLYGNEIKAKGVNGLFKALNSLFDILESIQQEFQKLQSTLKEMNQGWKSEKDSGGSIFSGLFGTIRDLVSSIIEEIQDEFLNLILFDFILKLDIDSLRAITEGHYENARWLAILIIHIFLAVICFVAVIAIGSKFRILNFLFCTFAVIFLILTFILISIHLAVSLTVSDMCTNSTDLLINFFSTKTEKKLMTYLLECGPETSNPLNETLQDVLRLVKPFSSAVQSALNFAGTWLPKLVEPMKRLVISVDDIINNLVRVVELLHCTVISEIYLNIRYSVCSLILSGTLFMLLSCCMTGLLLSVLILLGLRACSAHCKELTNCPAEAVISSSNSESDEQKQEFLQKKENQLLM